MERSSSVIKPHSFKNSAIISLSDLKRAQSCFDIFNNKNSESLTSKNKKYDPKFLAKSLEFKKKIIDYDKTHDLNYLRYKNDFRIEQEENKKKLLEKAQKCEEENYDEVKYMNKLMLNAQINSVRDKQIEEKNKIKLLEKKREEKLFIISEIERLKENLKREKLSKLLSLKQKEGCELIKDQIIKNQNLKLIQKQNIQNELIENLKIQEKLRKNEENLQKIKKQKNKDLMNEILEANRKSLELRKTQKQKEIEEDLKLFEYNKLKMLNEEKKNLEIKKLRHLKEIEFHKLLSKQEKISDNKNLVEEIMQRRAKEKAEKLSREKELNEVINKKKLKDECINKNKELIEAKSKKLYQEALLDKIEFDEMVQNQKKDMESEKNKEIRNYESYVNNLKDIQKQIEEKKEKKLLELRENIEERRKNDKKNNEFYEKLNDVKMRKINELMEKNVNKNYINPLLKYNPAKQMIEV